MPDILFILRTAHFLCAVIWLGFGYALTFVMRPAGRRLAPTLSGAHDPRITVFADIISRLLKGYRAGSWGTVGLGFAIFFYRLNGVQADPAARSALLKSDWGIWIMTGMSAGMLMAAIAWTIVDPGLSGWINSIRTAGWKPVPKRVVWAAWTNTALSVVTLTMMTSALHGGSFWLPSVIVSAGLVAALVAVICLLAAKCTGE